MKKIFRTYAVIWVVLFALFQAIAFVSPGWTGVEKYTPSFWIGYVGITLALLGQLVCAYVALKDDDAKKSFYNLSLLVVSYTGLILSCVVGGLCMVLSLLPGWAAAIACAIVLALNISAALKATVAISVVSELDEKIQTKTFFIRALTVDAEGLMARAKDDAAKTACRKVYEAVRYSDPMSDDTLASVEGQIAVKFAEFSEVVKADDVENVVEIANEVVILIGDRNKKCKLLK